LASFIFMVAFGYMQYYSSFSPMDSGNNSTVIQVVRGLGAFAFFLSVLMFQWKPHIIYRIGFIFMITGYLLQPFFAQTPASLMIFGTVTMIGYVCFDIFIWVVLSEIVHVNQRSSAGAIALMWLVRATGIVVGMLVCHALFFFGEPLRLIPSGTVLVGYLTVIAMTLLLGDETGIWAIIRQGSLMRQQATAGEAAGEALSGAASGREAAGEALLSGAASGREAAGAGDRMAEYGFTPRQREVIDLVLSGRSAARIAVELGVSENTVVTHIRHIYRITGVNSRQDLIDALTDR
jgi:DNA-binding CsgD family transcriptional regulator